MTPFVVIVQNVDTLKTYNDHLTLNSVNENTFIIHQSPLRAILSLLLFS